MPLKGIQFSHSELTRRVALAFWSVVLLLCIVFEEVIGGIDYRSLLVWYNV